MSQQKLDEDNDEEMYGVKAIKESRVYAKESPDSHSQDLYYLVFSKNYWEAENI